MLATITLIILFFVVLGFGFIFLKAMARTITKAQIVTYMSLTFLSLIFISIEYFFILN